MRPHLLDIFSKQWSKMTKELSKNEKRVDTYQENIRYKEEENV